MSKPKVDHTNTKCCICGGCKTYSYQGILDWRRYKKKGEWDKKSYICYYCRLVGIETTQKYIKEKRKGRKCYLCEGETYDSVGKDIWFKAKNYIEGAKIDDYICKNCYKGIYDNLPCSTNNIIKSSANIRHNELSIKSSQTVGLFGETIIANIRKLKIISIEMNNFRCKFDLSPDLEYGIIQSKFRSAHYEDWGIRFGEKHYFDTLFALCSDKYLRNIERVYAIPEVELEGICNTTIVKNFSKYEKFRIDEKPYDNAYSSIKSFFNGRKYVGVDDFKKWLEGQ